MLGVGGWEEGTAVYGVLRNTNIYCESRTRFQWRRKLLWGGQSSKRKFRIKSYRRPRDKSKKGAAYWPRSYRIFKIESKPCTFSFSQGIIGSFGKNCYSEEEGKAMWQRLKKWIGGEKMHLDDCFRMLGKRDTSTSNFLKVD